MTYRKLILVFLVVLFCSALFVLVPRNIKIERIDCASQYGPCPQRVDSEIKKYEGKNLSEAKKAVTETLNTNIFLENFSVHFNLPNKLKVNLLTRTPKFTLSSRDNQLSAFIDKEGYVVAIDKSAGLPNVLIEDIIPNVGEKVEGERFFALTMMDEVYYFYQVRDGLIDNDGLVVELIGGPRVIFPLQGEKDVLLGALRLVLSRLNDEEEAIRIEGIREIDLRFRNPVLRS